jgi:fructose/tagatose bisphosphate aldolase
LMQSGVVAVTGMDTFAVAIGNVHGLYPVPKHLDLELLDAIRAAVPCHLSLHGGSGTLDDEFHGAVERGVSKININTEMRRAFRTALERELTARPDEYASVKLMGPVIDASRRWSSTRWRCSARPARPFVAEESAGAAAPGPRRRRSHASESGRL